MVARTVASVFRDFAGADPGDLTGCEGCGETLLVDRATWSTEADGCGETFRAAWCEACLRRAEERARDAPAW